MYYIASLWKPRIATQLQEFSHEKIVLESIILNIPPDEHKGDIAFPMFSYAKMCAMAPAELAVKMTHALQARYATDRIVSDGPYINIFLDRAHNSQKVLWECGSQQNKYGSNERLLNTRIMIEFSAPNTNKPLHIGHLRNDALGESVSRILKANGAEVRKVNIMNDRGVHICKSMLAYQKFGNNETPETRNMKADHFVGDYYVRFNTWNKDSAQNSHEQDTPEQQAQHMLKRWEMGDESVISLWKQMNAWALQGILHTYKSTGISFDTIYYESETYTRGKQWIIKGLEDGVFYKDEPGAVRANLEALNMDSKVLLRSDGTSVYITQDVGTAEQRYIDWPFDKMIYVVAYEQNYHFQVLFHILKQLQFPPALQDAMYHLGYGMVHLPEGRMKSREGEVVDADILLDRITTMVLAGIDERQREDEIQDTHKVAKDVALGAIHYYLLRTNPKKDIIFHPKDSITFQGNTGPYLQYTAARITSMLNKFALSDKTPKTTWNQEISHYEWRLVLLIDTYPTIVEQAATKYDPSLLANYLYDVCSAFSNFYQNVPIAKAEDEQTRNMRVLVSRCVLQVLKNGLELLNIPYVEKM